MSLENMSPHELVATMARASDARFFHLGGLPGTGKTTLAVNLALETSGYVIKVTLNDGDMAAKYEGFFRPVAGGEFAFFNGLFTEAWVHNNGEGCAIVIDEVDHASAEVLSQLYAYCDAQNVAKLTLPTGAEVTPGPKFRVFFTSNQPPSVLPEPLADRMEVTAWFESPSPDMMARLDEDVRSIADQLMHDMRTQGKVVTYRDLLNFCRFRHQVGESIAAQAAFGPDVFADVVTALSMVTIDDD